MGQRPAADHRQAIDQGQAGRQHVDVRHMHDLEAGPGEGGAPFRRLGDPGLGRQDRVQEPPALRVIVDIDLQLPRADVELVDQRPVSIVQRLSARRAGRRVKRHHRWIDLGLVAVVGADAHQVIELQVSVHPGSLAATARRGRVRRSEIAVLGDRRTRAAGQSQDGGQCACDP